MSNNILTRIAPTPSGYLHFGNIVNFLFIEKVAKMKNGSILLRIDDCDISRVRKEYVEHIFSILNWLDLKWDLGPKNYLDFTKYSQNARKIYYWEKLKKLSDQIYACDCSRKEVGNIYAGTCRNKNIDFIAGTHALRLKVDDAVLSQRVGDIILWRKDNGPAYHWVSVIDDLDHSINLIIRGKDLEESSEIQKYIAKKMTTNGFDFVEFIHHPLITSNDGEKLSKSKNSISINEMQMRGVSVKDIREKANKFISTWNLI